MLIGDSGKLRDVSDSFIFLILVVFDEAVCFQLKRKLSR